MRSVAVRLSVVVALLAVGGTAACDHDSEERHLTDMANEIDHLQVALDEQNRSTLATDVADTHSASVAPRMPAPSAEPPPVLRVGDDGPLDTDSPDTDDPTPRPTIRLQGSPSRGGRAGDVASSFVDDGSGAAPPPSSALDPSAQRDYDAALSLVNAHQYDKALDALAAFLVKFPDHPYADNAMYWRGECYFAKGDYLHAAEQFEGVVTRFPAGNKAPDAMLKLGVSNLKLGNPAKAKEVFDRLAQTYPQSDAAHRIPPVPVQATTPSGPASEDHRR